mgnify:CR=1 FL=1
MWRVLAQQIGHPTSEAYQIRYTETFESPEGAGEHGPHNRLGRESDLLYGHQAQDCAGFIAQRKACASEDLEFCRCLSGKVEHQPQRVKSQ